MNEYAKAEEILLTVCKSAPKANKIAKLLPTMLDSDLIYIMQEYYRYLTTFSLSLRQYTAIPNTTYEKTFYNKNFYDSQIVTQETLFFSGLITYIREVLNAYLQARKAEQKPAWQVMAEKNGWAKVR